MAYVLIKGGRIIDPASQTDRPLDVGKQGGRFAKVTADIDASEAAPWVDARQARRPRLDRHPRSHLRTRFELRPRP